MKYRAEVKDGWLVCKECGKKLQRVAKSWVVTGVEIKCPRCAKLIDVDVRGFELGTIAITQGVAKKVKSEIIDLALTCHFSCHWGAVGTEDWQANDLALIYGGRILSVYYTDESKTDKFWIITEADRNSTTILLPDEY